MTNKSTEAEIDEIISTIFNKQNVAIDRSTAKAALEAAARARDEWQPIETAPRDGTEILVCNGEHQAIVAWEDDNYASDNGDKWYYSINSEYFFHDPTHWQPLPQPPKEKENE